MAVGTTNFPASLDDAVSLVEVKNNASTTLTSAINSSVLSIPIADPSEFPETGIATLTDSLTAPTKTEIFIYTSKSGSNLVVPSGGRGQQGTTANSFSSGHYVELRPTAGHHEALRGAIIAIETKLGTGSDTAASGQVLIGNGSGTSEWRAIAASDLPTGIDAAKIGGGAVSNTEFGYLDGVTSAIQTQLDSKAASSHNHAASDITSGQIALARGGTGADLSATGAGYLKQASTGANVTVGAIAASDLPTGIDAAKIGAGAVSNTEFGYLDGVTSAIQTQLDAKAASTHSHAASDITSGTLAIARGGTATGTAPTNGQLLIGNAGGGYSVANLTAGSNITITNGNGAITIASSGGASGYSTVQEEGTGLTQRATLNFAGSGITAADNSGQSRTDVTLNAQLNSLADLASNGVVARTASNTITARTITGTSNRVTVTNGDGVSGNPTLDIGSDVVTLTGTQTLTNKTISGASNTLSNIGNSSLTNSAITIAGTSTSLGGTITQDTITGLAATGLAARTAVNTLVARTLTGTSNRITITNGDGVSGNPTFDIGSDVVTLTGTQTLTNKTLTSPSVAKLANLTTNGFVKTSAGDGTLSIDTNTYLTGNQTITLSGDVSGSGTTGITATIGSNAVTNAKLATVATQTFKGRTTAGTGNVEDLTVTQATALLNAFTGDSGSGGVKGLVPAPASGDAAANKYLKADGTWATVSGSGGDSVSVNGSAVTDANFTSTPAAPAGGANVIWQTSGSGPASVSGYVDTGSLAPAFMREPYYATDFLTPAQGTWGEFSQAVISSGTVAATSVLDGNHPGVILLSSSTTTNSGARIGTDNAGFVIGGGERFDIVFRTPSAFTNTLVRMGLHDSTSSNAPVDGAWIEFSGSGACTGNTSNASTASATSTIATLSVDTWYHATVIVNSAASSIAFTIYAENGNQLGTQSLTTNIPGSTALLGARVVATNSGTTSVALLRVDYMSVAWTKALTRGQ